MDEKCQFIEKCPMFEYFCNAAKLIYRAAYCEGSFEKCKRRQLRLSGQPVPNSMLPQGSLLWDEKIGEQPPKFWIS